MNKLSLEEKKLLLIVIVIIALYFLIVKPILIKLHLQEDPERKATEDRKKAQLEEQQKTIEAQGQQPTKTKEEWQVIADQIYEDLRYSALSDNKEDAGYQVARVKNDADFWLLYKLFAKRREYYFGIPFGDLMDLQQFVTSNLSKDKITAINGNYRGKGIKFQF